MPDERPIAIQFSDLRGFSHFTAAHGDREAFRIANQFTELVGSSVEKHDGKLLKTYGDGVMTCFDDPVQAIVCAAEMQELLCEEYCGLDEDDDPTISAGIGLTWGTAILTGNDLFGHSVNLAKRLSDEAKGGQIVTNGSLLDETGEIDGYSYRDMGARELKGLGEESLFEVIWRPEVARIETADNSMDIILTDDNKVVVELGKSTKDQLEEVLSKLQDDAASGDEHGLARFIKQKLAKRLAKSIPNWTEWGQMRAGLGIAHAVQDVSAEIKGGKLTLQLGERKKHLSFSPSDIDETAARAFVERLERMKATALNRQQALTEGDTT